MGDAEVTLALRLGAHDEFQDCGSGCGANVSYIPAGTWATGRLESDRPILAIVNDWSEAYQLDMSTYTALPCRAEGSSLVALP